MFTVDRLADPTFFAENRLPAHSDHVAFADAMEMAEGVSSLRRSLNGIWSFHYARNLRRASAGLRAAGLRCQRLGDYPCAGTLADGRPRRAAVHEPDVSVGRP